ncbi:MAG: helix-turn-helix transcriptional regulator [Trueperaceae bacterium]
MLKAQVQHYCLQALEHLELLHVSTHEGYTNHFHENYGFCWLTHGEVKTHHKGSSFLSVPQSLTVTNPDEVHRGDLQTEMAQYYSFYPCEQTLHELGYKKPVYFRESIITDTTTLRHLCNFVCSIEQSSLELQTYYLVLIGHVFHRYAEEPRASFTLKKEMSAVLKARDYLHAHRYEDIKLEELATLTQLSRAYFIRAFKKTFGMPPHAYLIHLRINEAKKRLVVGETVADVAIQLGFADQSHFSRTFKGTTGISPAYYAKAIRL